MALTIEIKVMPSSGRQGWTLDKTGALKCFLKSPPERGLANQELVKLLSKSLKVRQEDITIIMGMTSRKKTLKINAPLTYEQILALLGIQKQQSFL